MTNVVPLPNQLSHARAVRARLWNPPNARQSSELDVASGSDLRKRRALELQQREELKRAEEDFRRQIAVDDLLRKALAEHIRLKHIAYKLFLEDNSQPPKVRIIQDVVAREFKTTRVDIVSHRRTATLVLPRWIAMYLASVTTFKSTADIARHFGDRDHTTVLHAVKQMKARMAADAALRARVLSLQDRLSEEF